MVIRDYFNPSGQSQNETESESELKRKRKSKIKMAPPLDRLAGAIVDFFLVIFPVTTLIGAPFKRKMIEALILKNELDFSVYLSGLIVLSAIFIILYHATFTYFFGATIGKLLFGLRVELLWKKKKPPFSTSLVRASVWLLDCVLLFIPHLEILSNLKRRPLHDRVADTVVVTIKPKTVMPPGLIEASFVKGVAAAFMVFSFVLIGAHVIETYLNYKNDYLASTLEDEENSNQCKAVREAELDWPTNESGVANRLEIAMTLFAAGVIDRDCLSSEVDISLNRMGVESPLAYLAQSFVYADKLEVSDKYLDKVCAFDSKSPSCAMSVVVNLWSDENWIEVEKRFNSLIHSEKPFIYVWAIRHFSKYRKYRLASKFLGRIGPINSLSAFLGEYRTKILWGMGKKSEARAAMSVALDNVDYRSRIELASWFCYEEVQQNCTGLQGKTCQWIREEGVTNAELLAKPEIAYIFVKNYECQPNNKENASLASRLPLPEAQDFSQALRFYNRGKLKRAKRTMRTLSMTDEYSDIFRKQAKWYLMGWAASAKDLHPFLVEWRDLKDSVDKTEYGRHLFSSYYNIGDYKNAFQIGQKIYGQFIDDRDFQKSLVVSAYKLGQRKFAWRLLSSYNRAIGMSKASSRSPASQADFSMVSKILMKEFSAK